MKNSTHPFVILTMLLIAGPSWAQSTSCPGGCPTPPRNARYEAQTLLLPALPSTLLSATLRRGKPGTVLAVEAAFQSLNSGQSVAMVMYPRVNGVSMDSGAAASVDCGGTGAVPTPKYCSTSGVWWIDLDQHGALIGAPLVVDLIGGVPFDGTSTGQFVRVSMSVHLERK